MLCIGWITSKVMSGNADNSPIAFSFSIILGVIGRVWKNMAVQSREFAISLKRGTSDSYL